MSVQKEQRELAGKTIEWAGIVERPNGDAQFVMKFLDGSTAEVAAWQREGHSLQMNIDLSPNTDPQTDGGTTATRGI